MVKIAYGSLELAPIVKGALPANIGIIHSEYLVQYTYSGGGGAFLVLSTVRGFISGPVAGGIKAMAPQVSMAQIRWDSSLAGMKNIFGADTTMAPIIDTTYLF